MPAQNLHIPLSPEVGFDGATNNGICLASRNMIPHGGQWNRRPGYAIRRTLPYLSTASHWLERIPLDLGTGVLKAVLHYDDDFVEDVDAGTSVETSVYNPLSAAANYAPSWVHFRGKTIWVANGTAARVLLHDGSAYHSLPSMADPGSSTLSTPAVGSMTIGTWYVRVRWYDSKTGTYSGPQNRTSAAASATTSGSNLCVQVTRPTLPSRSVTHWQVQLALNTDTPSNYEIQYSLTDTGGSPLALTTGLIPVNTTTVQSRVDPASGTQFEFRTMGASTLYRHANFPPAHFVTQFRGRLFFASASALWLVWSETDNPEHFYHDTTDPAAGFNTVRGEGLLDSVASPCTGLVANETVLLFFTRNSVTLGEGSWVLETNGSRDARLTPLTQNTIGAVSGRNLVLDQDIYFWGPEGPAAYGGGQVQHLLSAAVRPLWRKRDMAVEHKNFVLYDPLTEAVMFCMCSTAAPASGTADLVLPWMIREGKWGSPLTFNLMTGTLHRLVTDGGTNRGTRLLLGTTAGVLGEYGYGYGDGADGNGATYSEDTATSSTTTSITKTGAGWTSGALRGMSIVLYDPATGNMTYRTILNNTTDTISWEGTVTAPGGGWKFFIGGIPATLAMMFPAQDQAVTLQGLRVLLDDSFSRLA